MNALIGRLAAVIAAALVMFVLNRLGLQVSDHERDSIINWLTQGLTALGTFGFVSFYAIFHKFINRYLAPGDTAAGPVNSPLVPPADADADQQRLFSR